MKTIRVLMIIAMPLMCAALAFLTMAQSTVNIKAVKLSELYPSLESVIPTKMTLRTYLRNSSSGLDKSFYYNREEGTFYFIDHNGQVIQSFNLKRSGLENPGHYKWSPDGTMIICSIFNKNKGGASGLYFLRTDGIIEEAVSAENNREQILQPSISWDGKSFTYLKSGRGVDHEIWVKNFDSGEKILVERVSIGEGACGNPIWFNRHKKILYRKSQPQTVNKRPIEELWLFDMGTRQKKKIYEGRVETIFPIISPDDSLIGTDTGKFFSLFDASGNFIKNLEPGSNIKPSWSPNGLNIAYLKPKVDPISERSIEQHIHAININTSIDKDLTLVPGLEVDEFRWYNDSTIVY